MQQTTNYALKKIELADSPPDITVINPNWDSIDVELKRLSNAIEGSVTEQDLIAIENKIGALPDLTTNAKANLVVAINELRQSITTHSAEDASTLKKGHVQLSDATNSTSTILAATANAVKKVWDMAAAKYSKPTGGIPKADLDSTTQNTLAKADSALQSVQDASTTVKGITQLSDATNSTSVFLAATANAVKKAWDLANSAIPKTALSNLINGTSQTNVATEKAVNDARLDAKNAILPTMAEYGLGNFAKGLTDGTNLNLLDGSGTFMGQNLGNAPSAAWHYIEHMRHNTSFAKQTAHALNPAVFSNSPTWMRMQNNGVWSAWSRVLVNDSTRPTGANLNNYPYTENGTFALGSGTIAGPSPVSVDWGTLVTNVSGDVIHQEALCIGNIRYTRAFTTAGGWTGWKQTAMLDGTIGKTAKGSYVGDNTNNRYFEVGFKPSLVFITKMGSTAGSVFLTSALSTRIFYQSATQAWADGSIRNATTASGFYSSYNSNGESANNSGATYEWIALG